MGILCLFFFILLVENSVSVKNHSCYGEQIFLNCSADEILKINEIDVFAKKATATNCTVSLGHAVRPELCCYAEPEDCKMEYKHMDVYFKACMGKNNCSLPASWQQKTGPCKGSEYLAETTYMITDYRCIAKKYILPITSNRSLKNLTPTLGGPGHPASNLSANTSGACSVSASCRTTINITAIDLSFQNDSQSCKQYIDIEENGVNKTRISCADNNEDHKPKTLYTSRTHFFTLRYNNTLQTNSGRMWIEFNGDCIKPYYYVNVSLQENGFSVCICPTDKGADENATVEIRCGTSMQTSVPEVKDCPQSTSSSTLSTASNTISTDISTLSETVNANAAETGTSFQATQGTLFGPKQGSSQGPKQETKGSSLKSQNKDADHSMSTGKLAGIVSGSLLALVLLIFCLLVWRHKNKMARKRNRVSDSGDTQPEDEFAAALGITGRSAIPGSAPASSALGAPPSRLPPIGGTTTGPGAFGRVAWDTTPL